MPKIIENLESKLLEAARHQVAEAGYSAMTIRSVAKACGVGVGTVYNYFPSKDALLATYMLADWSQCIREIQAVSAASEAPLRVVTCICHQLIRYARQNQHIFQDPAAASAIAGSFSRYHGLLRSQLAAPLRKFCRNDFTAEFIAESLLTWTMAGRSTDEICGIIEKLF